MNGNGAAVKKIARTAGVADGTVTLYTDRVISVLLRLASEFLRWPQTEKRREISRRIAQQSGIVSAMGIVDGTHINFAQRPAIDREVFSAGSIDMGSMHRVHTHLSHDDSLSATSRIEAYQLNVQFTAFSGKGEGRACDRDPEIPLDIELRVHIRGEADFKRACDWCSASVVLHNIVTTQRDDWDEDEDEEEPLQRTEIQKDGDISAARWRSRVKDAVVAWAEEQPTRVV
ncbi:hypothetical protein PsorP6_004625 [Peronosclerospora sorghi]|uniref:Uncharacterized protein n=1 Tax=Peronosclerospora sorghi TaxID=230839 RepID=A0ACC0VNI1_9STRA|nr:hypothetical protein PsorP6_004625 [Peronosclerospora sorghi]